MLQKIRLQFISLTVLVEQGFDTLNELYLYLKNMLADSESGEIAKTLYEPFFTAYEGGIRHE